MSYRLGMFEPETLFKVPTACKGCGYKALYWHKHDGKWRLHHYTNLSDGKGNRFVPHRCGFDSAGNLK